MKVLVLKDFPENPYDQDQQAVLHKLYEVFWETLLPYLKEIEIEREQP